MKFCDGSCFHLFIELILPSRSVQDLRRNLQMVADKEKTANGSHSMYPGASCAFVALHMMSRMRGPELEQDRRSRIGGMILLGSAQLLGLLVEKAQRRGEELEEKLKKSELEVWEMKQRRSEDAKANEKVVGIFATHEQSWIAERKGLRLQIQALTTQLSALRAKHQEDISNLNRRVMEEECAIRIKDEAFEEEAKKRRELEEKLVKAEDVADELRDRAKKEAENHSYELRKHKTAFAELISSQRQLEAEIGRALRQADTAKLELEEIFERKEEAVLMVEKLSEEIVKLQKDAEQKDKILSAMLRKSKLDTADKQMLLKELKLSKAKKKQAELETERWRNMWESRNKRSSRESHFLESGCSQERRARAPLFEYFEAESEKQHKSSPPEGESIITTVQFLDQHLCEGDVDLDMSDDIQHFQDWVRLETEKYANILEERHYAEIEAFTEQMRVKDEKLEAFRWRMLSMELESKRLQSHIEGLDGTLSQLKEEELKLESLLLDKEEELKSLKEQFSFYVQHCQKSNSNNPDPQSLPSDVGLTKRKPREKEQEAKAIARNSHRAEESIANEDTKLMHVEAKYHRESMYIESRTSDTTTSLTDSAPLNIHSDDHSIICINEFYSEATEMTENSAGDLITYSPKEEIEEEKEVNIDPVHNRINTSNPNGDFGARKDPSWKMDIHALGVSYKIKRLKQQLLVLEKLVAEQITTKDGAFDGTIGRKVEENRQHSKAFMLLVSLLNKQLKRFQSLEEKTDDLCSRMHQNSRAGSRRDSQNGKRKEQTKLLESFLEETFQLQRYMVATGQKLMDVQSRISFAGSDKLEESAGFNMGLFADVVRTLFREIQRGLEVRIARIIGDLEGTLACDGILHR